MFVLCVVVTRLFLSMLSVWMVLVVAPFMLFDVCFVHNSVVCCDSTGVLCCLFVCLFVCVLTPACAAVYQFYYNVCLVDPDPT